MWAVPVIVVLAIGSVWLRLKVIKTSYQISQTQRTIANLRQEQEQLSYRVSAQRSPRRLELLARTRFGLMPPKSNQVVYLKAE